MTPCKCHATMNNCNHYSTSDRQPVHDTPKTQCTSIRLTQPLESRWRANTTNLHYKNIFYKSCQLWSSASLCRDGIQGFNQIVEQDDCWPLEGTPAIYTSETLSHTKTNFRYVVGLQMQRKNKTAECLVDIKQTFHRITENRPTET